LEGLFYVSHLSIHFYTHPSPKLEICPLSVDLNCLFNIFTANIHIFYIKTKIPPQFSPSSVIQISPLCSHTSTNITVETKHTQRLTLLRTKNSPRPITLRFTSQDCILLQPTFTKAMISSVLVKQAQSLLLPPSSLLHHLLRIPFYALMWLIRS
jgi:hypothetical protein